MLSSFSSKAIISKARARYGRRLTKKDYKNLLNCSCVPEIAAYLKNETSYKTILTGVNEKEIHRGRLEVLLREKMFYDLDSLCRYELSTGEHFAQYIISRSVIEQILHILMLLNSPYKVKNVISMPDFLINQTHIDMKTLANAKNYDEVLKILGNTGYGKILKPFAPKNHMELDLPGIENALYTYLYKDIFDTVDKHTRGKTKKQLSNLFNNIVDLENYIRIIRLKKRYKSSPDFIRSMLLPFGTIKETELDVMISAKDYEETFKKMANMPLGRKLSNIECIYVDELALKFKQSLSRHYVRFSSVPVVVMLSYLFLAEIETINIIHIVEGVRYNIPTEEIQKLLIETE